MFINELCSHLHNYFEREIVEGDFQIINGEIDLPFMKTSQYYCISGSIFNDGVHRYGDKTDNLTDESFTGRIIAMAIPPLVIAISSEIEEWIDKNEDTANSPYTAESFGGYSYNKGSAGECSWQSVFRKQLNRWRKL